MIIFERINGKFISFIVQLSDSLNSNLHQRVIISDIFIGLRLRNYQSKTVSVDFSS